MSYYLRFLGSLRCHGLGDDQAMSGNKLGVVVVSDRLTHEGICCISSHIPDQLGHGGDSNLEAIHYSYRLSADCVLLRDSGLTLRMLMVGS